MSFTPVLACRSCGSSDLFPVLDLGEQPLANDFRRPDDPRPQPRYPLATVCCATCSLVQLTGTVPPTVMFDDYAYLSSYSDTMVEAMRGLAARVVRERALGPDSLVVEPASNDGYLLQHYAEAGVGVLGIEPAANVAAAAEARGIRTVVDYLTPEVAARVVADHGEADVVHANNVIAHVPGTNEFAAALATLVGARGVVVIESPYLLRLVEDVEFDTIYHEHVFYWSLTAFAALFARHGLRVVDVEQIPLHGGSLRLFLQRTDDHAPAVTELLERERVAGIASRSFYAGFADRVAIVRERTSALLTSLAAEGATVAGYGAAAKGTVFLNHLGEAAQTVSYVVDRNEHKQGLTVPGTRIAIRPPSTLEEEQPDFVLLLAWNLADEVLSQQQAYRRRGGKFIIPIPELEVIS